MESKTYKDYSIKELQTILKFSKSEYKNTGIKESYNIYKNCQITLFEIIEYLEEVKTVETENKLSLFDKIFRPFKKK